MLQQSFSHSSMIKSIVGRRIRLEFTPDRFTELKSGALGVVSHVDDLETVFVNWDDGSSLGLIPEEDEWSFVN